MAHQLVQILDEIRCRNQTEGEDVLRGSDGDAVDLASESRHEAFDFGDFDTADLEVGASGREVGVRDVELVGDQTKDRARLIEGQVHEEVGEVQGANQVVGADLLLRDFDIRSEILLQVAVHRDMEGLEDHVVGALDFAQGFGERVECEG